MEDYRHWFLNLEPRTAFHHFLLCLLVLGPFWPPSRKSLWLESTKADTVSPEGAGANLLCFSALTRGLWASASCLFQVQTRLGLPPHRATVELDSRCLDLETISLQGVCFQVEGTNRGAHVGMKWMKWIGPESTTHNLCFWPTAGDSTLQYKKRESTTGGEGRWRNELSKFWGAAHRHLKKYSSFESIQN